MKYPSDIMSEVLFTETQIIEKAKELAQRINQDYDGKPLTIVCTLKGATFFFADLMFGTYFTSVTYSYSCIYYHERIEIASFF